MFPTHTHTSRGLKSPPFRVLGPNGDPPCLQQLMADDPLAQDPRREAPARAAVRRGLSQPPSQFGGSFLEKHIKIRAPFELLPSRVSWKGRPSNPEGEAAKTSAFGLLTQHTCSRARFHGGGGGCPHGRLGVPTVWGNAFPPQIQRKRPPLHSPI